MNGGIPAQLTDRDEIQLAEVGISRAEAERQLALLRSPPSAVCLDRPCTVGDGILARHKLTDIDRFDGWKAAAAAGRLARFVPASGAASRMFEAAQTVRESGTASRGTLAERAQRGDSAARDVVELIDNLARLPFAGVLSTSAPLTDLDLEAIEERDDVERLLEALLGPAGLGLPTLPKGLIPFHLYSSGPRTAFEEHLAEASELLADRDGICRFHFTVPRRHQGTFEAQAARFARRHRLDLRVEFSHQEPSTHTLAVTLGGEIVRRGDGRLRLRPGGHGALLHNLERARADLVLIKNIDNVAPAWRHAEVFAWHRRMFELLVRAEGRSHRLQEVLEGPDWEDALEESAVFCREQFGWAPRATSAEGRRSQLLHRLDRPLRVCGMVRNEGEPGGGPFWVRDGDGAPSRQIVESAQIDRSDPAQLAVWQAATHFNPVLLVASLRDRRGEPYSLAEFVDQRAVLISEKTIAGRQARVLEHPGLWNGGMADWNTLFVEVPMLTFAPVKTVLDLLRPGHRNTPD